MHTLPIRYKRLNEIEGLEDFGDYAVDVDGNIWSFKHNKIRKLRPGWVKKKDGYLFVRLSNNKGVIKSFYVHRLVAMAYLRTEDFLLEVNHINGNHTDNRIENLEWITKSENRKPTLETKGFILDEHIANKIKEVHSASHRKGVLVPNSYEFVNNLIENALDQYIAQYGLRKIMNNIN